MLQVKPIVIADMLGMPRTTGVQDAASIVIANVQSFLNSVVYVAGGPTGPTSDELRASVANSLAGLEGVPGTGSEPTGAQWSDATVISTGFTIHRQTKFALRYAGMWTALGERAVCMYVCVCVCLAQGLKRRPWTRAARPSGLSPSSSSCPGGPPAEAASVAAAAVVALGPQGGRGWCSRPCSRHLSRRRAAQCCVMMRS